MCSGQSADRVSKKNGVQQFSKSLPIISSDKIIVTR